MDKGYHIFLMIQLAIIKGIIKKDIEYDSQWERGQLLYEQFEKSKLNDLEQPEYKCIVNFLDFLLLVKETNAPKAVDVPEFLLKTDWELLKKQKQALLAVIESDATALTDELLGLLYFIDAVQDYAVDAMGVDENTVFNLMNEDE